MASSNKRLAILLLLACQASCCISTDDKVAEVRQWTGYLMAKGPDAWPLEPEQALNMVKRCKELMADGLVEELRQDQELAGWWTNINDYIAASEPSRARCLEGNFFHSLLKFGARSWPQTVKLIDHYKQQQDELCKKSSMG